jgi:tRNA U34 5-carboxymethylaminomethyl modifying enzyme MnmG/GidA
VAAVLIVGGGAAGCEFAWGLAERGIEATLVTTSLDTLYTLPMDTWRGLPPGGSLWGMLAAEAAMDAPTDGGSGGRNFRAASLRRGVKRELERLALLRVVQSNVVALLREGAGRVVGVRTWEGPCFRAQAVVLAVGSFLGAQLRVGSAVEAAGRLSEMAYDDLYRDLLAHGVPFVADRLEVLGDGRSPGYSVDFQRFAPEALAGGTAGAALRGHAGVWALGACAAPLSVEGAAAAGRDLARAWPQTHPEG